MHLMINGRNMIGMQHLLIGSLPIALGKRKSCMQKQLQLHVHQVPLLLIICQHCMCIDMHMSHLQVHFLGVGPDEKLYIPQGSPSNTGPCNVVGDIRQCAINRMNLDGSDLEVYVTGESCIQVQRQYCIMHFRVHTATLWCNAMQIASSLKCFSL